MTNGYSVAIAGATGAVGERMLTILEQRNFPVKKLKLLASSRSIGRQYKFAGDTISVEELKDDSFNGVEIALFSIPSALSKRFSPIAASSGCVVVDNSNAFRMDPGTPLVVPEVNPEDIKKHKGIIANPNCSTIQMVLALKPIYDAAGIQRVVVTTFQAISGAGYKALEEFNAQAKDVLAGKEPQGSIFPYPIAFNALPQIPQSNAFEDSGYTTEEMKMVHETRKILGDDQIQVSPTTVRVPVVIGHSEAVNVQTRKPLDADAARRLLDAFDGIKVLDDPKAQQYPVATMAVGRDETFVGRIRNDPSAANCLNMWIVADNLRKGAALNAIQIAEKL